MPLTVQDVEFFCAPPLVNPTVSGGLMTYDFQGSNGATTTLQTSGSLSTTMTLNNSSISNIRGPSAGSTSLFVNGTPDITNARAEVTGLNITPTNFTWEGWIWNTGFTTTNRTPVIFSVGNDSQNLLAVRWQTNTLVEFRTNISNGSIPQSQQVIMSATPASGVWQHHAITADGTNYRYYLDGVLRGQTTANLGTWGFAGTSGRAINTYTIGNWLGAPFTGTWNGAHYWNCRLSGSVVYSAPFTVTKTGMVNGSSSLIYSGSPQDFIMAQLQPYGIGWTAGTESFFSLDGFAHTIVFTERITNFSGNPAFRESFPTTRVVPATGTLALGGWVGTPVGIAATSIT